MNRIPEEELMDSEEQARAYADEDYSGPHDAFISYFKSRFSGFTQGKVLDLGCGPADITIRFAKAFPDTEIIGLDGAQEMLTIGINDVKSNGLSGQITLKRCLLPDYSLPPHNFDAIISNSLLHHLADPEVIWQAVKRCAKPGASIFVMDLMRPENADEANKLVELYASDTPPILKKDFYNSLLAAYQIDEVKEQLSHSGLDNLNVEVVSDRHLIVWGTIEESLSH
jgi:ubiquinone/menaquinone biosynthesis C-methylase UbiE